ncbi:hypothetical protein MUK42_20605 [Musa troglodytarum]|uniref:Uncharacterized protein n=1 Tax=Musa troglodytarum TaxID=320322 RepID=A0A9E7G5F4_9LILI|nr:hypothetical protein MUK42_20605 [Musa troglodytarum]
MFGEVKQQWGGRDSTILDSAVREKKKRRGEKAPMHLITVVRCPDHVTVMRGPLHPSAMARWTETLHTVACGLIFLDCATLLDSTTTSDILSTAHDEQLS